MQELESTLRNTLLSAGLIAIAVLVYWPSTAALWHYWTNDNYVGAHGLLIVLLAVWLFFLARRRLAAVRAEPSAYPCVALLVSSLLWLIFWRAGIQELHLLLLPVLMGLAVWAALGFSAALAVAFPLGYLYFAVPAWGVFAEPLQELTARATGVLAPLIGVPAQMHGDLVLLPGVGAFEIERGCSGINFLTVGLAVAALLGELEQATLRRRALLLGVMGALAILANWIRVLIIVDAGYTTQMRHVLVSRGHYMFGWVLFTTIMVAFVWLLARPYRRPASEGPNSSQDTRPTIRMSAYVTAVAVLVAMPVVVYTFVTRLDAQMAPLVFSAPAGRAGWQGPIADVPPTWNPDFVGPHSQWDFTYRAATGHNVEMVAIGYPMQAQGQELVSEDNSLFGAAPLTTVAETTVTLDGKSYIETLTADERGRRSVVWSVYDIGGREFVTPLMSQLWYGVRSLGGPPYSVLFAFRTECADSCDSARATLRSFVQTMGPDFLASVTHAAQSPHTARST
jgi:EpsI family protein